MCRNIVQPPKRQIEMILWMYMKEENLIYDQIILTTMTMLPSPFTHSNHPKHIDDNYRNLCGFFLDRHTHVTGF